MANSESADDINTAKKSFETMYQESNPRSYFAAMRALDYQIPQNAKPYIEYLIYEHLQRMPGKSASVLDLGCSYGVLASLIKYNMSLDFLYNYHANCDAILTYSAVPARDYLDFYGLDISRPAIEYATSHGLLTAGLAQNLEQGAPVTPNLLPKQCDIVTSTGCFGYITDKTLAALLTYFDTPPFPTFAIFVMRPFDYSAAMDVFDQHGFVTRKLQNRAFRQRRFFDAAEQAKMVDLVQSSLGRSDETAPLEEDGFSYAELYISQHRSEPSSEIFDVFDYVSKKGFGLEQEFEFASK